MKALTSRHGFVPDCAKKELGDGSMERWTAHGGLGGSGRSIIAVAFCALLMLLGACDKKETGLPKLQGALPGATAQAGPKAAQPFTLLSSSAQSTQDGAALVLRFSAPLASSQSFDQLLTVTGPNDEAVNGSWELEGDGSSLEFPYVMPNRQYRVRIRAGLRAEGGQRLGQDQEHRLYSGNLKPAVGFASSGSVLPARGSRGLPLVSVNVPDADIEFFRIRGQSLSDLFCAYPFNKQRSGYALEHRPRPYNSCPGSAHPKYSLADLGSSVYANHYSLTGGPNERRVTYIPVHKIPQLAEPGLYMAVVKPGGSFAGEYDTAVFFVSDLGLHLRAYRDSALLHVASLQDGSPVGQASIEIDDENGQPRLKAVSDSQGNALLAYRIRPSDVLLVRHGKDLSILPFNRPALDLSNFDIAGRRQQPLEIYAWSGRDLYRPGETLRVSALLRDFDGRAVAPQPLYARLRQPDGRTLPDLRLQPRDLNAFQLRQALPADAPTGLWQAEFRLDPAASQSLQSFAFHVEEFLPERLKLELASTQARLAPGQPLALQVAASYLYGAPAAGNRFTARLLIKPQPHPLANLPDVFFGNPLLQVPQSNDYLIDAKLDEQGRLTRELALPKDVEPEAPLQVTLSGSVYESGGRTVNRSLQRGYWPATELVGVRPLFDPRQGADSEGRAAFEIVRATADGALVAASGLKVRLQREIRDFYWLYDNDDWQSRANAQLSLVEERDIQIAAGARAKVDFPVQWGNYRLQVYDPATRLTTVFPFFAGYSWDDQNLGKEARPDKVKLALDKARYRAGDTLKVTLTPPHEGKGVLLVESDHLLYVRNIDAKAGASYEIPVTQDWERHDVYLSALVLRGGQASRQTTPMRALGIAHVAMERGERRIPLSLSAPSEMRPGGPLEVKVQALGLAGQQAYVSLAAVDQGVLNITDFAAPDAWSWFFGKRALASDARDLYGRVIEAMDGAPGRQRYGGDLAAKALPHAGRINPRVAITDLFTGPVAFDAQGQASLRVQVPDFNGSLRLTALAWGAQSYGNAGTDISVRAPLVVEPSTPRVMAEGDQASISLDLKNLSGKDASASIEVSAEGPIQLAQGGHTVALKNGAGTTLHLPVSATAGAGVARLRIHGQLGDYAVDRSVEFAVRPAWPQQQRGLALAIANGQPARLDAALASGLIESTQQARLTLSTLPPLPYASALGNLLDYPHGCIEQTTSKGYGALYLDAATAQALGLGVVDEAQRRQRVEAALARISSFQTSNGHFSFWGGASPAQPFLTPYVADFLLDAREAGFAVPEQTLQKALQRLNDDLLSGAQHYYGYQYAEHLRIADQAWSGFVLARVNRAPLGALRNIYDNLGQRLVTPLPLVHLGVAFKLAGDEGRARRAIAQAFAWSRPRPWYVGDYGSELRDLTSMVALTHSYGLNRPSFDSKLIDWARDLAVQSRRGSAAWSYLSTQEQVAVARIAKTFDAAGQGSLGVTVESAGRSLTAPAGKALWSLPLTPAQLAAGVQVRPAGQATLFASLDVAGIPQQPPAADDSQVAIRRQYFTSDGQPWAGGTLREGEVLIAQISLEARQDMPDALVTDLLPGGLEVENLNLSGPEQWENLTIDGVALERREDAADIAHEEYRDDRYSAALNLRRGRKARLFYLVRAVTPGRYRVPMPLVEDMYRPALRGIGIASPAQLTVVEP